MQKVAVLGREQKDQPVDETEKLAKEFGQRQHAGLQALLKRTITGMREQAIPQAQQRRLDAGAQFFARGNSLLLPGVAPALERAFRRQLAGDAEPAGMG